MAISFPLTFTVIGVHDVTTDSSERFVSCDSDGTNLYIGTQNINSSPSIWKYQKSESQPQESENFINWINITDSFPSSDFAEVSAIFYSDGVLYIGTGKYHGTNYAGQVWSNDGSGWTNLNLVSTGGYNSTIRSIVKIGNSLYVTGAYGYIWRYTDGNWFEYFSGGESAGNYTHLCISTILFRAK
jgi:hypothetical protein